MAVAVAAVPIPDHLRGPARGPNPVPTAFPAWVGGVGDSDPDSERGQPQCSRDGDSRRDVH